MYGSSQDKVITAESLDIVYSLCCLSNPQNLLLSYVLGVFCISQLLFYVQL